MSQLLFFLSGLRLVQPHAASACRTTAWEQTHSTDRGSLCPPPVLGPTFFFSRPNTASEEARGGQENWGYRGVILGGGRQPRVSCHRRRLASSGRVWRPWTRTLPPRSRPAHGTPLSPPCLRGHRSLYRLLGTINSELPNNNPAESCSDERASPTTPASVNEWHACDSLGVPGTGTHPSTHPPIHLRHTHPGKARHAGQYVCS